MGIGAWSRDQELHEGWNAFCEMVRSAGERVFKDENGPNEVERCSAFQFLTQNLSQAFDIFLENRDTRHPFPHPFCSPIRKLGCDDADCTYYQSWINDHDTYRISGTRGSARMFNIALQGPWTGTLHEPFGDTPIDNIFGDDLDLGPNGEFEIWLSPEPHEGNWVELKPGSRKIFYRQYFDHWDEEPAQIRIERVGPVDPPPPLSADALLEAMQAAGGFVVDAANAWPNDYYDRYRLHEHVNEFVAQRTNEQAGVRTPWTDDVDARRGRIISHLIWELRPDQALVIEFDPAEASSFWQVTNMNLFGASMDFRYRQVNLTSGTSVRDHDGKVRLVMAHTDPGFANWIDTQGHERGWFLFRNVRSRDLPELSVQVVDHGELDALLGPTSPKVTPEERDAELHRRGDAYARRFPTLGV
jgi:hypothetical protein